MLAYVSLAWDPHDSSDTSVARTITSQLTDGPSSLLICLDRPGLRILLPPMSDSCRPVLTGFRGGLGAVIGTIFPSRSDASDCARADCGRFSEAQEAEALRTEGRSILSTHWGAYVAFLQDPRTTTVFVLRGPMSSLPCFWTAIHGVTAFFSRPPDLADSGVIPLRINWDHVRAQAVRGDYLCEETGLKGVFTLLSGDCMVCHGSNRAHRIYWSPTAVAPTPRNCEVIRATQRLGTATRVAVNSWCSLHKSIIVSLSGGFDSSVVLSCAASAPSHPEVRAVNLYSGRSADERMYARSMTKKWAVPLVEVALPNVVDLSPFLNCARTASPVLHFGAFATEPMYFSLANQFDASAVFTGEFGDCALGHAFGPELLAEALWRFKLHPAMLRIIGEYARLYRVSVWHATWLAVREYRRYLGQRFISLYQRRTERILLQDSLATQEAVASYESMRERFIHPWLKDAATGPPGWLQTIPGMIMMTSTWTHSGFSAWSDRLFVSPLASQPVVEALLETPSHLHICGAENAAVARLAFGDQLSEAVLSRGKGKGTGEPWLRDVVSKNREFLRELLLDGLLVREGILDKSKVDSALSQDLHGCRTRVGDLMVQVYIESWLRRWTSGSATRCRGHLSSGDPPPCDTGRIS